MLNRFLGVFIEISKNNITDANKLLNAINDDLKAKSCFSEIPLPSNAIDPSLGFGEIQKFYDQNLGFDATLKNCLANSNGITDECRKKIINILKTKTVITDSGIFYLFKSSFESISHFSTDSFSFDTRTSFAIFPNFGYVFYGLKDNFNGATPFVGTTFNFRYIDRDIPLKKVYNPISLKRIGVSIGMTSNSIAKNQFRSDLLSNKISLLGGFEYRITHAIKIGFGSIFYWKLNPNPLFTNRKLSGTPYIGLSLDLKVKQTLSDIASIFTSNQIDIKRK